MKSEKLTSLLLEVNQAKEEIKQLTNVIQNKLKASFHDLAKELFNKYPELKSFGWRQYTPYFNDGEACEFRSYHTDPVINGVDLDYGTKVENGAIDIVNGAIDIVNGGSLTIYDDKWNKIQNPNHNPYYSEIVESVNDFLNSFDKNDMYDLFGDHVKVKITSESCIVTEYDHD